MDNSTAACWRVAVLLREPRAADAERSLRLHVRPRGYALLSRSIRRGRSASRCASSSVRGAPRPATRSTCSRSPTALTDEPLGITSLRHLDPVMGTAQIGTWLRRESWGAGVNAEAKALLLEYAFGRWACTASRRVSRSRTGRSRNAFVKLGGRLEGTLRQSFRKNGTAAGPGPLRDSRARVAGIAPFSPGAARCALRPTRAWLIWCSSTAR